MEASMNKGIFQAPLGRGPRLRALAFHCVGLGAAWAGAWLALEHGVLAQLHGIVVLGLVYFLPLTYLYWIVDRGVQIFIGPSLWRAALRAVLAIGFGVVLNAWPVLALALWTVLRGQRVHRSPKIETVESSDASGESYYPSGLLAVPSPSDWAPHAFGDEDSK